jgi:hypothetical protein
MMVSGGEIMPGALSIELTKEQRTGLENLRDHSEKAYLRERASALLKIADGWTGRRVAREGLLRRRRTATVYEWVQRYREEGVGGLHIKAGRGRKPAFSPSVPGGS